jgi:hypothetical protein
MSYLRGIVRKTRAPRPQIVPRATPAADDSVGFAEITEDVIVAPALARVEPAAPALPQAPIARRSSGMVPADEPLGPKGAPPEAAADPAFPVARTDAPRPVPENEPPQTRVSRHIRTVLRNDALPRQDDAVEAREEIFLAADLDPRPLVRARSPRAVEREPSPWRDARPGPVAAPSVVHEREPSRPDVHISIGRLEVRASVAAPERPERPQPFQPRLTLQDYLARRSRGPR